MHTHMVLYLCIAVYMHAYDDLSLFKYNTLVKDVKPRYTTKLDAAIKCSLILLQIKKTERKFKAEANAEPFN